MVVIPEKKVTPFFASTIYTGEHPQPVVIEHGDVNLTQCAQSPPNVFSCLVWVWYPTGGAREVSSNVRIATVV